jgi:hypothetical protein
VVVTENDETPSRALSRWATFRGAALEQQFRRDGYVVVDFAIPEIVAELLAGYGALDSGIDSGYYPSFMSADLDYRARTHRLVSDALWPVFDTFIEGYEALLGVFMVKHPGPDTEVPPHQDWIVADESLRPTMNVWLPLTPVTADTGLMRVLPGSHHWLEGLRGSPSFPTQWEAIHQRVRDELMVPIDLAPGQAMLYDIRILHGTAPNRSDETRVVTSLYAIPQGASPVHYYRGPAGDVQGYKVPPDFCATFTIGDVPDGEQFTQVVDYSVEPLTFEDFAARYAASRA